MALTPNTSATGGALAPAAPEPEDTGAIMQRVVVATTGLPGNLVRPRWQQMPPGIPDVNTDWCAIGVTEDVADTYGHVQHNAAGQGTDTLRRHATVEVLASFYGPHGRANAARLRDGLLISQNREVMLLAGIGLQTVGSLRRSPDQVSLQWIDRWDLPIALRRVTVRTYAVLNLLSAPVATIPE